MNRDNLEGKSEMIEEQGSAAAARLTERVAQLERELTARQRAEELQRALY